MHIKTAKFLIAVCRTRPMWGLIPIRLVFGIMLVIEGLSRLTFVRHHPSLLSSLPHPWGGAVVIIFSVIELLAGALAIPGIFTRFAGLAILSETTIAIFVDRLPFTFGGDFQVQMLLLAIASLLLLSGGGRFSLDHLLACRALKVHPIKKWQLYCVSETEHTKWWE